MAEKLEGTLKKRRNNARMLQNNTKVLKYLEIKLIRSH
jgi:hypothetical protein